MENDGLKTAVDLAITETRQNEEQEQVDLFGVLPMQSFDEERGRRPGRPVGARNKRTQEFVEVLLKKYPSPLEGLLSIASRDLVTFAADLKTKDYLELLRLQVRCMEAAAPYIHQKQPQAIEATGENMMTLVIQNIQNNINTASGGFGVDDSNVLEMAEFSEKLDEGKDNV